MLLYKMTYTFQEKETGRKDDTLVAKYMNYKSKTPSIQSTTPQVFKELMYVSGNTSVQQNDKINLFIQEKIHSVDHARVLLCSYFLWQRAQPSLTHVMSHYSFKSRRQRQGWQGAQNPAFWKDWLGLMKRFGSESVNGAVYLQISSKSVNSLICFYIPCRKLLFVYRLNKC